MHMCHFILQSSEVCKSWNHQLLNQPSSPTTEQRSLRAGRNQTRVDLQHQTNGLSMAVQSYEGSPKISTASGLKPEFGKWASSTPEAVARTIAVRRSICWVALCLSPDEWWCHCCQNDHVMLIFLGFAAYQHSAPDSCAQSSVNLERLFLLPPRLLGCGQPVAGDARLYQGPSATSPLWPTDHPKRTAPAGSIDVARLVALSPHS
jgi:hypothetical protein